MAGARGFVAGLLGLTLLEAFVTSKSAPAGLAGISTSLAGGLNRYLDPTVPLIPVVNGGAAKPAASGPPQAAVAPAAYTVTPPTPATPVAS